MSVIKKRYDLTVYQLLLFIFFSYLLTNHYTVASKTYFMIAIIFITYSFVLESLLIKLKISGKRKYVWWGFSYCPPMFLTMVVFIVSCY